MIHISGPSILQGIAVSVKMIRSDATNSRLDGDRIYRRLVFIVEFQESLQKNRRDEGKVEDRVCIWIGLV